MAEHFQFPELPKSLLTDEHKHWMKGALRVLDNLEGHIEQAHRAGVPGIEEHRKEHARQRAAIQKFMNTYFPQG